MTPFEEALQAVVQSAVAINAFEEVPLAQAGDRIVSTPIHSPINVPGFDNSAMDGYAVVAAHVVSGKNYVVSSRIPAGAGLNTLEPETVARIFTGAPMPRGADAVIMQENATPQGERVSFTERPSVGQHVRSAGDDIATGKLLVDHGAVLGAADIGMLASVGFASVSCFRKPVVGLLSTGDELVQPGEPLGAGQIYNSNRFFLARLLECCGAEVRDLGACPDSLAETRAKVEVAAQDIDCLVTTGGMSVGEEDHIRALIDDIGSMQFSRVAMKPGKPVAFGELCDTHFFGLPGNPVSAFATFYLLVRPWLLKTAGRERYLPTRRRCRITADTVNKGSRTDFRRVSVTQSDAAELCVEPHAKQGSGVLSAVAESNAFLPLQPTESLQCGDLCEVILIEGV